MGGRWAKYVLGAGILLLAAVLLVRAFAPVAPQNSAAMPPDSAEKIIVNKIDPVKNNPPKWPKHPKWGGAENSVDLNGAEWFNHSAAHAFVKSVDERMRGYVVELNARAFLPLGGKLDAAAISELLDSKDNQRAIFAYVQFLSQPGELERQELLDSGVQLAGYVTGHAWAARATPTAFAAASEKTFVRAIARIDPRDKLNPGVYAQLKPQYALLEDGRMRFDVITRPGVDAPDFKAQLAENPALSNLETIAMRPCVLGARYEIRAQPALALAIAAADVVGHVAFTAPPMASRDVTTNTASNVTVVKNNNSVLDGTGVKVAVRELGLPDQHVDFKAQVTYSDTTGDGDSGDNDHATGVVGVIASSGASQPTAIGIAPKASVYVFSAATDGDLNVYANGNPFDPVDITTATGLGAHFSNHSYGPTGLLDSDYGSYGIDSAEWDAALLLNMHLAIFAGNEDRMGDTYKGIDFFVGMKNGICVGASSSSALAGTSTTVQADGIADFSNFGPMNDGRVKPDLVAYGGDNDGVTNVILDQGTNSTQDRSGTSFATPAVSGMAALVVQEYKIKFGVEPTPAMLKAILCQTATDLGNPGPDAQYGFGIVNAEAAIALVDLKSSTASPVYEGTVSNGQSNTFKITIAQGTPKLKVTLCWMDQAGDPNAAKALVNDLDLTLIAPDSSVKYPFSLNPDIPTDNATASGPNTVDNIEQVSVSSPAAGVWTVKINGTSIPSGTQPFAVCFSTSQNANQSFVVSPSLGYAPLDVLFDASGSVGNYKSYVWDFGDGSSDSGILVNHTFTSSGTFSVKLTLTNLKDVITSTTQVVTVIDPLKASFVASPSSGPGPLHVNFSAISSKGGVQSYEWDFGDELPNSGSKATGVVTSHTFTLPKIYTVTLKLTDVLNNTQTYTKQITVTKPVRVAYPVAASGNANFSATGAKNNQFQCSFLVPELALTAQQARNAVREGKLEGNQFEVSMGADWNALGNKTVFITDKYGNQAGTNEAFNIDLIRGLVTVKLKQTALRDLKNNFFAKAPFNMSATSATQTFALPLIVRISSPTVDYKVVYKMSFTGSKGVGTVRGTR